MKYALLTLFIIPSIVWSAPYFSVLDEMSFGELLGFPGSCEMNGVTGVIGNPVGNLCLADKTGTVGSYMIVSSPNKIIRIKINRRFDDGNGIIFIPSGTYQVTGESDIEVIADQFQNIDTGDTGFLFIKLGGVLTASQKLNFATLYSLSNIVGIEWDELP